MLKYSSISHSYVLYMHEMLPVGGSEREREREREKERLYTQKYTSRRGTNLFKTKLNGAWKSLTLTNK
jgi:hypothetical protein